jgi:hypothetical protein
MEALERQGNVAEALRVHERLRVLLRDYALCGGLRVPGV